ncbi:predicted protein [Chaetoceros tenuissimus]|uniref:Uncharacterized protein n=1 Tax=Chaetoceros tenuissimus TaxID=426638 RepID=A0AAD3H625_9STRA|nr:predicted protein [Chaetoceros tenuissimus]
MVAQNFATALYRCELSTDSIAPNPIETETIITDLTHKTLPVLLPTTTRDHDRLPCIVQIPAATILTLLKNQFQHLLEALLTKTKELQRNITKVLQQNQSIHAPSSHPTFTPAKCQRPQEQILTSNAMFTASSRKMRKKYKRSIHPSIKTHPCPSAWYILSRRVNVLSTTISTRKRKCTQRKCIQLATTTIASIIAR